MEEEALSSRLSTSEKLLISQAVYKLGALDWEKLSGLLVNHPVIEGRPAEWFDAKTCEAYYVGLMTEAGINVYVLFSSTVSPCTSLSYVLFASGVACGTKDCYSGTLEGGTKVGATNRLTDLDQRKTLLAHKQKSTSVSPKNSIKLDYKSSKPLSQNTNTDSPLSCLKSQLSNRAA